MYLYKSRTIAKVSVSGSGFMSELLQDIDSQFLPGKRCSPRRTDTQIDGWIDRWMDS